MIMSNALGGVLHAANFEWAEFNQIATGTHPFDPLKPKSSDDPILQSPGYMSGPDQCKASHVKMGNLLHACVYECGNLDGCGKASTYEAAAGVRGREVFKWIDDILKKVETKENQIKLLKMEVCGAASKRAWLRI